VLLLAVLGSAQLLPEAPRLCKRALATPEEIRALREREQVSQPVFAHYLNVRKDAVSKWERGEKRPDGPSLKLLNLVKAKGLRAIA
jgi:putative transcriptional regulator